MGLQDGTQARKLPTSHAEAQRKYREKNLEATRAKARERMKRLRARRTPEEVETASRQRKEGDADYRELEIVGKLSRNTKGASSNFISKYGESQFFDVYFPLYAQLGQKHLPGLKFANYYVITWGFLSNATVRARCLLRIRRRRERRGPHGFWSVLGGDAAIHHFDHATQPNLFSSGSPSALSVEYNSNYKNDSDHDSNTRKFWFLVFGKGLYTKKKTQACRTDADAAAGSDNGVHIFNTRAQASRAWSRHCRRRHSAGCHETKDPAAHQSDADSDTDDDTEDPGAPSHSTQEGPETVLKGEVVGKSERLTSTARAVSARAVSVPVKRAAATTPKAEPASPKKLPLYADMDDSDDDLCKSDSSIASRAPSAFSGLEEDKDVPMPLSHPIAPSSPTMSSVSSLATSSVATSTFLSISGALRATAPPAAGPSTAPAPTETLSAHMLFNRGTRVLYDDPKSALAEKNTGESMQVVDAREIIPLISALGTSGNLLYNRKTRVLYDDLRVAVEERKPGESMQVVDPDAVVPWISGLGR
ncbi:hypothetical protein B0H14DRAFT_2653516 [Mycena olivaceomarginata]|nr:hypothetical protein B0H14DRAFT_2653516 [Mycena olivaceomarginata]